MILLKNMKTKVAMLAPCKNGSTSIESAWQELLSDYEKKHECKIKNSLCTRPARSNKV